MGVNCISVAVYRDILLYKFYENHITCDLTRPHPKWWFNRGKSPSFRETKKWWNMIPSKARSKKNNTYEKNIPDFLLRFVESSLSPTISQIMVFIGGLGPGGLNMKGIPEMKGVGVTYHGTSIRGPQNHYKPPKPPNLKPLAFSTWKITWVFLGSQSIRFQKGSF